LVDVAIVGAGPAGAAAACYFARLGFTVALIDRRRFPRDKVCGDFVGPLALAELDRLGLASQGPVYEANRIHNAALHIDGKLVVEGPLPQLEALRDYGTCVPRMLLDEVIVKAAVASGARSIEDAQVTGYDVDESCATVFLRTGGRDERLRCRLLLGADGSASLIARRLRGTAPPRYDRIAAVRVYFDGVTGPADRADLYVDSPAFPGYCWLFPTGANGANVGVGMPVEIRPPVNRPLREILLELTKRNPALRARLANATMRERIVGWPLATFDPNLPIVADRVALIGDAAGLINPLNGEGIQYALQSARWCARSLLDALASDNLCANALDPYVKRVREEMHFDMALASLLVDIVRNRALNPLWLWLMRTIAKRAAGDSGYANTLCAVLAGIAPVRRLLEPRFAWATIQQVYAATSALK